MDTGSICEFQAMGQRGDQHWNWGTNERVFFSCALGRGCSQDGNPISRIQRNRLKLNKWKKLNEHLKKMADSPTKLGMWMDNEASDGGERAGERLGILHL